MTKQNENLNDNSLYGWATGKVAGAAIGLAVATFIYKSGIIQNVFGKLWKSDPKTNPQNSSNERTQTQN